MDEQGIAFVANYGDWQSVKKLKISGASNPRSIMEFLASLNTGLDRKIEENLGAIINLESLDKVIEEQVSKGKKEANIAAAIAAVSSMKTGKVINEEIEKLTDLQKGEKKEVKEFCKVYALRKAVKTLELPIDYSQIPIPGMKRLLKKKEKKS